MCVRAHTYFLFSLRGIHNGREIVGVWVWVYAHPNVPTDMHTHTHHRWQVDAMAIVGELLQGGEHSLLKSSAAAAAAAGSLLGREMTATLRAISTLLNRGRAQDMVGASGGSDGDHRGVCKLSKKRVRDVRLFLRRLRQTVSLFCSGAVEGATSWGREEEKIALGSTGWEQARAALQEHTM